MDIREFAYLLKFIFNPRISIWGNLIIIDMPSTHISSCWRRWNAALLFQLSYCKQSKCLFHSLCAAPHFPHFCAFLKIFFSDITVQNGPQAQVLLPNASIWWDLGEGRVRWVAVADGHLTETRSEIEGSLSKSDVSRGWWRLYKVLWECRGRSCSPRGIRDRRLWNPLLGRHWSLFELWTPGKAGFPSGESS